MRARVVPLVVWSLLVAGCGGSQTAAPEAPAAAAAPAEAAAVSPASAGEGTRAASFELDDNKLVLPGPIVFREVGDETELDAAASRAALNHIRDYLMAKDYITLVRLEGHGDAGGEQAMVASGTRALLVGMWLVREGIDCKRLLAVAFGDTKPIAAPTTPEGRARNRRIEVVNAELRGRAIGGMPVDGGAPMAAPVCD